MLNPRMNSWGSYEATRRRAEELKQQPEPQLFTAWTQSSLAAGPDKLLGGLWVRRMGAPVVEVGGRFCCRLLCAAATVPPRSQSKTAAGMQF
jgi:hypothetical protein